MTDYQYKKLPLTPSICRHLILELFNGRLEKRQNIVDEVTSTHLLRGGEKAKAVDKPRMVKKALEKLQGEGLAKNPSYGFWLITVNDVKVSEGNMIKDDETRIRKEIKEEFVADFVSGVGDNAVYLYYLPAYQALSQYKQKDTWACKIGETNRDPFHRVLSQASTALPERPKIAVIIKTKNSRDLEKAIHKVLILRNKQITTAVGEEWFDTSPDEFLEIVQFIKQSTLLFKG
ncbi:GIY-YIG nuclease family protein [Neobacillus mesonae]|uniref:Bacteriophage T5 Orf172 DNA-binding domain-containing protein n=1 Tax=Neobacillus mesonae TaxID=1193713 RepID=A0A3T0HZI6_9BACI|nr:GIY-YIG nuclease family protein [Neobacillus mesonae]AZU62561.1 hypothetical protein CHR53_15495 [Neobacillus mesonae]